MVGKSGATPIFWTFLGNLAKVGENEDDAEDGEQGSQPGFAAAEEADSQQ